MSWRIGIDVGGTFTDFALRDEQGATRSHKVLSTPADPSLAVLQGLGELAAVRGQSLADFLRRVDLIVHGTTVTTNAVLTGRTARAGLLATDGFRDALAMRRGVRESFYDNKLAAPAPLVPRYLRLPVRGRIDHRGNELEPLALDDVERAVERMRSEGVDAVAICFLHAWANPAHEEAAAALVARRMPEVHLSVSSRVLPQLRYYERTSTTVLNAAVGPILARYLANLRRRLADGGFTGALRIMQSNGGVTSPEAVAALPASTLLSGPAAAPAAALAALRAHRETSFISVDMGGTSFDAALVVDGAPAITTASTVSRHALALPSMDIATIGAGGGSIAWIDDGLLKMGPQSAGADPGPACYGRGGTQPTCSDANLVLGYLSPTFFAGGAIGLDAGAAHAAIEREVARPLGLDVVRAAHGMHQVMNVNMAAAMRGISVQKGWDARDFVLVCAGGAGAIHAALIARELGMRRVLVPADAAILCAAGMLGTDLKHDFVRSHAAVLGDASAARLAALADELEVQAHAVLHAEGIAPPQRRLAYALDLRYRGQYHEVSVAVSAEQLRAAAWAAIGEAFHQQHDRLYGYALRDEAPAIEMVSLRLAAVGETDQPTQADEPFEGEDAAHARKGSRAVFEPDTCAFAATPVYDGDRLRHGNALQGPAIVEKVTTTVFVPAGWTLAVDAQRGFLLEDKASGETR